MPRGQRKPAESTEPTKPAKPAQTAEERALDAVRKAYQKYDQTQDRAIEADKKAAELHAETAYLRRVFLHAGTHPDLPDDFNAEQFIADEENEKVIADAQAEPVTDVAVVTTDSPIVEHDQGGEIAASEPAKPADEDDPFANLG